MDIMICYLTELDTGRLSMYAVKDDYVEPSMVEQMIADLECPLDAEEDFEWDKATDNWICTHPDFSLKILVVGDTSEVILYRQDCIMKTFFMNPQGYIGTAHFRVDRDLLICNGFKVFKDEEAMYQAASEVNGLPLSEVRGSDNQYRVGLNGTLTFTDFTDTTTNLETSFIKHSTAWCV